MSDWRQQIGIVVTACLQWGIIIGAVTGLILGCNQIDDHFDVRVDNMDYFLEYQERQAKTLDLIAINLAVIASKLASCEQENSDVEGCSVIRCGCEESGY